MSESPTDVPALRALVAKASASQVEIALANSLSSRPGEWLTTRQKYADGNARRALSRIHPLSSRTGSSMLEYAAASVFLHAADAWSLLGRAMAAFAAGDTPIAQHLLYYSELRSAQAILASNGIVVLDKNPFIYLSTGATETLRPVLANPSTHRATWDVFSAWCDEHAALFIGETIRVSGKKMSEWETARPASPSFSTTIPDLIRRWGFDLDLLTGDRDLRNAVSYEPSRLISWAGPSSPASIAASFREMWQILEPAGASGFENFDRRLLRQVLQVSHDSTHGSSRSSRKAYSAGVRQSLSNLGVSDPSRELEAYLTSRAPEEDLFRLASTRPASRPRSTAREFLGMRGRALILGRFSLGAARTVLERSGSAGNDLSFWAEDLLSIHGVNFEQADTFTDLWDETEISLEDIESMSTVDEPGLGWRTREWAQPIHVLSSFERVAAWSVL